MSLLDRIFIASIATSVTLGIILLATWIASSLTRLGAWLPPDWLLR
jgi:hypothetical protein